MEKINIAELLKDCPNGMELDCNMYDGVSFVEVTNACDYPIKIKTQSGFTTKLTKYGQNINIDDAKCIIFPKGKTTWEGFVPPCKFKDGDILTYTSIYTTTFIYRNKDNEPKFSTSFYIACNNAPSHNFLIYNKHTLIALDGNCDVRLATEEEKERLFDAIKKHGYKWNTKKRELERLIEPKFKVGARVKHKDGYFSGVVTEIDGECYKIEYDCGAVNFASIKYQDDWELVPNKFDITTLKPFKNEVLVRDNKSDSWEGDIFIRYDRNKEFRFICLGGGAWKQCIPYERNEHLLGITTDCAEYYQTWE